MRIKHPTKGKVRSWISRQITDDQELFVLVDIALSDNRRAWLAAFDTPASLAEIETPWGRMTRWFAASTIAKDWWRVWKGRAREH